MAITTTTDRTEVFSIQKRMLAIHAEKENLAKNLMNELGSGEVPGINLDNLSAFARQVIELNREFQTLSDRHRELLGN